VLKVKGGKKGKLNMGIKGLSKFLNDNCPRAVKEIADMKAFTGRKVAIDASMAIYQFLVAVRSAEKGGASMQLTDADGNVTR
jgi:flap endonuclease-1